MKKIRVTTNIVDTDLPLWSLCIDGKRRGRVIMIDEDRYRVIWDEPMMGWKQIEADTLARIRRIVEKSLGFNEAARTR